MNDRNATVSGQRPASTTAILPWLFVGIPFAWAVIVTIGNASALFK